MTRDSLKGLSDMKWGLKIGGREDLEEMCHLMEASVMIREKIHVGYTRLKCVV